MSKGTATLPPAGAKRKEELDKRIDALDEAAEKLAAETGKETIDPAKLEPDHEILSQLDMLSVTNKDPLFKYCWVYTGQNGFFVTKKKVEGWQVVQGEMKEAIDHRFKFGKEDTCRRIGDTVLLRIRLDKFMVMQRRTREVRTAQEDSVKSLLIELGDKYGHHGVIVHTDPDEKLLKRMGNKVRARGIATQQFNDHVRQGTVPGAEVGR